MIWYLVQSLFFEIIEFFSLNLCFMFSKCFMNIKKESIFSFSKLKVNRYMLIYPCGYYIWVHMPKFFLINFIWHCMNDCSTLTFFYMFSYFCKTCFLQYKNFFSGHKNLVISTLSSFYSVGNFKLWFFFFNSTLVIVEYQATYLNLHISKTISNFGLILFIVRNLVYFTSSTLPLFYFFSLMLSQLSYFSHFLLLNCY